MLSYLNVAPPLSHKAKLAKTFEKSKMPAPPRPKAELREGKALPTAPRALLPLALGAVGRALLPLALGAVGRALPSLSSAFGRGGGRAF